MATTDVSIHNHGNEDTEASFTQADVTTWLTIKVGDSKVTFFINKDQAKAIGKAIMDETDAWVKV